ncbi:hypothetical protein [Actinokineospora globicatena]|uniref:hypothetical protein n=1 Tax=Actinokineospora globicatena TaxID=103729 RepID=UPI0020A2F496|nr:hypothetical protein [Actinokineospora globicatena]
MASNEVAAVPGADRRRLRIVIGAPDRPDVLLGRDRRPRRATGAIAAISAQVR